MTKDHVIISYFFGVSCDKVSFGIENFDVKKRVGYTLYSLDKKREKVFMNFRGNQPKQKVWLYQK